MKYIIVKHCETFKLVVRHLRFSLPPTYLDYADYLNNFELAQKNTHHFGTWCNKNTDFVKTHTKRHFFLLIIIRKAICSNISLKRTLPVNRLYVKTRILLSKNPAEVILVWRVERFVWMMLDILIFLTTTIKW